MAKGLIRAVTTSGGLEVPAAFWKVVGVSILGDTGEIRLQAYRDKRAARQGLTPIDTRSYHLNAEHIAALESIKISDLALGATKTFGRAQEAAALVFVRQLKDVLVSPEERDPRSNQVTKEAVYESFFAAAQEGEEE